MTIIEALLNESLKDNTVYCNNCQKDFRKEEFPCCENPKLGTNAEVLRAVIAENDLRRSELYNSNGATRSKSMRIAFSLPVRMYSVIKRYFAKYGENFPKDNAELHSMMRKFRKLTIPKDI